jgi:hypothetical protein
MEHRNKLNKKKKKAVLTVLSFWVPCIIIPPILATAGLKALAYYSVAFLYIGGALFYLHYYFCIRCPKCNEAIGFLVLATNKHLFKISEKILFCPFCSVSFDK